MNLYNREPGPPRVLIDNWVEERSLYETALNPDGTVKMGTCRVPTVYVQTTNPDQKMPSDTTNKEYGDFRASKKEYFNPNCNADTVGRPVTSGAALEARFRTQAEQEWAAYVQLRQDALDGRARELACSDNKVSTYTADYSKPEIERPLTQARYDHPVTLYSTGAINVRRTGPELGRYPRHAQFSTPIEENKRGQWKDD